MFQNIPYRLTYQVFPDNVTFGQVLLLSSPGRVVYRDPELCSGMCTDGRQAVFRARLPPSLQPPHPPRARAHPRRAGPSLPSVLLERSRKRQPQPQSPTPIPALLLVLLAAPASAVGALPGRAPRPWAHPCPHPVPASDVEPSTQEAHNKHLLNDGPSPPKRHALFWSSPWCPGDKPSLFVNRHYPTPTWGILTGCLPTRLPGWVAFLHRTNQINLTFMSLAPSMKTANSQCSINVCTTYKRCSEGIPAIPISYHSRYFNLLTEYVLLAVGP